MLTQTAHEEWRVLQCLPPLPKPFGLLCRCITTEALEPTRNLRHYVTTSSVCGPIEHPSTLHKAVHDLYSTLTTRVVKDELLVLATVAIHRANFGLLVYKHPRPGIVHIYNKAFGERPLAEPDHIDIGLLYSAAERY